MTSEAHQVAPEEQEVQCMKSSNTLVRDSLFQVYQKSPLVKYGVDSLEWLASQPALSPYVNKATEVTNPYLSLADERISQTVGNLSNQVDAMKENVENRVVVLKENVSVAKAKVSSLAVSDVYTTLVDEAWFARVNEILNELSTRVEQTLEQTKVQVVDMYQSGKDSLEKRVQASPADRLYRSAGRLYIDFALAERVAESQEFLRSMKVRMGEQWNERLETPIREFLARAKETTLPELMKMFQVHENPSVNSVVATSIGLIRYGQEQVNSQWSNVLQATQDRVDRFLPTTEGDLESQVPTLGSVSRHLSKRVQACALAKMGQVKVLSSERLSEMQHFDLVAYAETYLDGAKATVSPRLEQVAEQLQLVQNSLVQAQNSAVGQVRSGLEQAKVLAQEVSTNASEVVGPLLHKERAQQLAEKLRARVNAAVVQLQSRAEASNLQDLPNQVATFFLSLQDQVNQVATPELNRLLDAIKSLFSSAAGVTTAPSEESDCCVVENPAEVEAVEAVELGDSDELPVDTTCGLLEEESEEVQVPPVPEAEAEEVLETPVKAAVADVEVPSLETPVNPEPVADVEVPSLDTEPIVAPTTLASAKKSRKKRSKKSRK
jgi:hypothetical protein